METLAPASQFLSFFVNGEEFALPILRVLELVAYQEPSRLPNAPPFLRGVIGVRGSVVPAIDLARVFGFGATPIGRGSSIILVEMANRQAGVVGIVVEKVGEVADVPVPEIVPPPEFGMPIRAAYLVGLYPARGKLVFIIDVDRVLSDAELMVVAGATQQDSAPVLDPPA